MKKFEIVQVVDELPTGFASMCREARSEGYQHLDRLAADWASRVMRFDSPGEVLLAAYVADALVGVGGLTLEPFLPRGYRLRRFYVRPSLRRQGVGSALAPGLIQRALSSGSSVTVNAGSVGAHVFWERLGFSRASGRGYTHVIHPAQVGGLQRPQI